MVQLVFEDLVSGFCIGYWRGTSSGTRTNIIGHFGICKCLYLLFLMITVFSAIPIARKLPESYSASGS